MQNIGPLPLGAGDEDSSDAAFRGYIFLQPVEVSFLAGERYAGPDVNAELHHLVAIVMQKASKIARGLPLLLRAGRQIECDDQPTHFEFFCVHGL